MFVKIKPDRKMSTQKATRAQHDKLQKRVNKYLLMYGISATVTEFPNDLLIEPHHLNYVPRPDWFHVYICIDARDSSIEFYQNMMGVNEDEQHIYFRGQNIGPVLTRLVRGRYGKPIEIFP